MVKKLEVASGEVYSTDLYGDVEVLEYTNSAKVKIRFKDTGSERYTEIRYLRSGKVRDISVENKVKLRNAEYVKSKNREDLLGKEFTTKFCGKCKVIDYKGWNKVVVEFYEPSYITTCSKHALITGNLNNPFYPSVYGKGYRGVGKYKSGHKEVVILWNNLLKRVFDAECHVRQPTYKGTSVCEEWLNFQNFAEWCYSQKFFNAKDKNGKSYCLDKIFFLKVIEDTLLKHVVLFQMKLMCYLQNEMFVGESLKLVCLSTRKLESFKLL